MGKELLRIGLLSAAILAIAACSKEEDIPIEEEQHAPAVHYATVILNKEDVTKTAVVEGASEASYVWTDGDEVYLHVYENGVEGKIQDIQLSSPLDIGYTTATLTVSFEGTPSAPYTYTAKYAKSISSDGNPLVRADQRPAATSFDPAADVMISKATADVTGLASRASVLSFTMGRVVSVNKMTLTGLAAGEKVSKVEFTLGKNFLGGYYVDGAHNSTSNKLTAIYETPLAVGQDGNFPVYFTCAPVDAASIESVVVTTDQKVYTKPSSAFSGKSISFAVGTMKRFTMGMSGCGVPIVQPASNTYTLVQSQSGLVSGATYIIVGNYTTLVAMAGQNTNNRAKVNVTATDNTITLGDNSGVYTFTISSGSNGYTIQDNSNSYYLWAAGGTSDNYLKSRNAYTDNKSEWNISISNGVASITNVGNTGTNARGVMCYNSSSSIFSCYKSATASSTGYYSLSLYKQGTAAATPKLITPTNLTAEYSNDGTVHVEWDAVTGADSYTVTCTGQTTKTGLTVCSTDFTGLAAGTYTITVTAISNNHNVKLDSEAASKEVTVTITAAPGTLENPYSASAAIEATNALDSNYKPDEEVYVTGIISYVKEYFSSYHSISYYISDDGTTSNQFFIYSGKGLNGADFASKDDLAVGDLVVVKGYLYNYNGDTPEMFRTSKIISLSHPLATATATVTTAAATNVGSTSATLNASFSGATGTIYDRGFRYKKGSGEWVTPTGLGSTTGTSGSFSMTINSLDVSSTYTFQAYVTEWDEAASSYVDRWAENTLSFTTSSQSSNVPTGWLELPATTGSEDYVGRFYGSGSTAGTNRNYSYYYNYTYYASMWVAYPLTHNHTVGSSGSKDWSYNPNIPQNKQVSITSKSYPTMYGASAYARGHQIPNASRYSDTQMNDQTYYATNQTPQLQNKFNASIWSDLEDAVRSVTSSTDTVYVATGPVYRKVGGNETINTLTGASGQNANPSSLPIPNYYWKVLLKVQRGSGGTITGATTIGFWYVHREYQSTEDYDDSEHIVSVNQIEQWTGLDLFHNLPDSIEETAESNTSWNAFKSSNSTTNTSGSITGVNDNEWGDL